LEAELDPLFRVEFIETNPIPIKTALAMRGMCAEIFRLPLCELEKEEHRGELERVLRSLEIIS
jgi:4-hydroxy-tetrahydrodipicolinate synthase